MLELKKCRSVFGKNCALSDSELELLRDQMYGLADIVLGLFPQKIYLILYSPYNLIVAEESVTLLIVEV